LEDPRVRATWKPQKHSEINMHWLWTNKAAGFYCTSFFRWLPCWPHTFIFQ
jgi:hypothetical protein